MNRSLFSFSLLAVLGWGVLAFFGSPGQAAGARPKLVMLIAEPEYKTVETLPKFAAQFLEKDFNVVVVTGSTAAGETSFDHIEELKTADVLLVSVRRRSPPREQMQIIKDYIMAGHPVVGIRTASHAFVVRGTKPKDTEMDWPTWDADIFGGSYTNHYADGPTPTITAADPAPNPNSTGKIDLSVTSVTVHGKSYAIDASVVAMDTIMKGRGVTKADAAKVAGGAVAGAIVGKLLGKNTKGAVIGGAAGAAAGAAAARASRDIDVVIPKGAAITVKLNAPLTVKTA